MSAIHSFEHMVAATSQSVRFSAFLMLSLPFFHSLCWYVYWLPYLSPIVKCDPPTMTCSP